MSSAFMSAPSADELSGGKPGEQYVRQSVGFTPKWQKYRVRNREFNKQFCHLYSQRLRQMGPKAWAAAEARWSSSGAARAERLTLLEEGKKSFIVGTLFKVMKLRHSVIEHYQKELQIAPQAYPMEDYTSSEDALEIEDNSGRMRLVAAEGASLPVGALSTGLVIAALGAMDADGNFRVQDWCSAGPPPQRPAGPAESGAVLLASGLDLGGSGDALPAKLLVDYATGCLGDGRAGAQVSRVILAGNSMARLEDAQRLKDKSLSGAEQQRIAAPLHHLDSLLAVLCSSVEVDILPGDADASSAALPQQPMHRALFPRAARYSSLHRPPNPYEAEIGSRVFMGSSGQSVSSALKFTSGAFAAEDMEATGARGDPTAAEKAPGAPEDAARRALDALEGMVLWGHAAPTAPDVLACYPFHDEDPFVLDEMPHVFFAGNQKAFGARKISRDGAECLLVSVPVFKDTGVAVKVDLQSLEATPICFKSALLEEPHAQVEAPSDAMDM